MLSKNKLYSTLGHWGVGAFVNKNLRTNEIAMETTANQTISSFDNICPYMDIARNITARFVNVSQPHERSEFHLLLNINYLRFFGEGKQNRFFRFYFETLPNYFDYLPFWKEEEKAIISKFTFSQDLRESLFRYDNEMLDIWIEMFSKQIRRKDPSFIQIALNDQAIKHTMNIIKTRTFKISLKGWKILHSKIDEVNENG